MYKQQWLLSMQLLTTNYILEPMTTVTSTAATSAFAYDGQSSRKKSFYELNNILE